MKIFTVVTFKDLNWEWDLTKDIEIKAFTTLEAAKEQLDKDVNMLKVLLLNKVKEELEDDFDEDEQYIEITEDNNVITVTEIDSNNYYNFLIKETELN